MVSIHGGAKPVLTALSRLHSHAESSQETWELPPPFSAGGTEAQGNSQTWHGHKPVMFWIQDHLAPKRVL